MVTWCQNWLPPLWKSRRSSFGSYPSILAPAKSSIQFTTSCLLKKKKKKKEKRNSTQCWIYHMPILTVTIYTYWEVLCDSRSAHFPSTAHLRWLQVPSVLWSCACNIRHGVTHTHTHTHNNDHETTTIDFILSASDLCPLQKYVITGLYKMIVAQTLDIMISRSEGGMPCSAW